MYNTRSRSKVNEKKNEDCKDKEQYEVDDGGGVNGSIAQDGECSSEVDEIIQELLSEDDMDEENTYGGTRGVASVKGDVVNEAGNYDKGGSDHDEEDISDDVNDDVSRESVSETEEDSIVSEDVTIEDDEDIDSVANIFTEVVAVGPGDNEEEQDLAE